MVFRKKQNPNPPARKMLEDSRFSMDLPPEWEEQASYLIVGPEQDGIQHDITVQLEHNVEASDIVSLAQQRIRELSRNLEAFQGLSHGIVELKPPYNAYQVAYKWAPEKTREVYQRMMFVLANHTVYTLTVTFSKKMFERLGPRVEDIFRSFSIV
ncbi:MAG: DUF1795 domain-containing protein [Gammaproteobacteria bacterium]|nr:DUF1795 domain-containing protein [Gammaproteobacteria bacterium]